MSLPVKVNLPLFHSVMTMLSGGNGFVTGKGDLSTIFSNNINWLR
jgi:hypothetical protein